jgi:AcrR family transcriptional regulator
VSARGRPRSAAADHAIVEAALSLFAERGLEGASIDEIARRAGVTRATIYRRWTRKEDLVAHALGQAREGDGPRIDDWSEVGADAFVRIMLGVVPDTLARPDLAPLTARLLGESQAHPELVRAYWDGYLAPRRAAFARAIAEMQAQGRLPPGADPDILQDMISGALVYRLLLSPPASAEAWRDYCRRLLGALGLEPRQDAPTP